MNFVLNHASSARSIARPVDQQYRNQSATDSSIVRENIGSSLIFAMIIQRDGLQVNKSNNRSCIRVMIHTKIHLISPGCPWPSITLQCYSPKTPSIRVIHFPLQKNIPSLHQHNQHNVYVSNILLPFVLISNCDVEVGLWDYVAYSMLGLKKRQSFNT